MLSYERVTRRPENSIYSTSHKQFRNVEVQMTTKYVDSTSTDSTPSTPTEKYVTTNLPTIKKKTDNKQTKSIPSPYVSSFKILTYTPRSQTGARKVSMTSKPFLTRTFETSPFSVRDEGTKTGARKVTTTSKPSLMRTSTTSPLSLRDEGTKVHKQFRDVAVQMTTKYVAKTRTVNTSTELLPSSLTPTIPVSSIPRSFSLRKENSDSQTGENSVNRRPDSSSSSISTNTEEDIQKRTIELKMVGVGGGWMLLREYLKTHRPIEVHMQSLEETKTGSEHVLFKSRRLKYVSTKFDRSSLPLIDKGYAVTL